MIAIDTNILIRFLTRDNEEQSEIAQNFLSSLTVEESGFVCREVAIETVWVLERSYRYSRLAIVDSIERLLTSEGLVFEDNDDVTLALSIYEDGGADFSDLMILAAARRAGAEYVITFDRRFSRQRGVQILSAQPEDY